MVLARKAERLKTPNTAVKTAEVAMKPFSASVKNAAAVSAAITIVETTKLAFL
jgi:hypothetical protein